jgi:hypothetical protein
MQGILGTVSESMLLRAPRPQMLSPASSSATTALPPVPMLALFALQPGTVLSGVLARRVLSGLILLTQHYGYWLLRRSTSCSCF